MAHDLVLQLVAVHGQFLGAVVGRALLDDLLHPRLDERGVRVARELLEQLDHPVLRDAEKDIVRNPDVLQVPGEDLRVAGGGPLADLHVGHPGEERHLEVEALVEEGGGHLAHRDGDSPVARRHDVVDPRRGRHGHDDQDDEDEQGLQRRGHAGIHDIRTVVHWLPLCWCLSYCLYRRAAPAIGKNSPRWPPRAGGGQSRFRMPANWLRVRR